ncbi:hypothetical protein [Shimazuella kribbensis]|nr:hypothetical protein [Shimazuella kribbensis]
MRNLGECTGRQSAILYEFETLDSKVAYMRDVIGITLPEIAAELGYSLI